MKNNITELVFIIDGSGSMSGLESDTVGGFNSMLAKQKNEDGLCWVSTVIFNNESRVIHDRVRLADVPEMTRRDYFVSGTTALLDAIGDAVHHIKNIHKYARPEDVPEHTLFVITTDGMENASRRYTSNQIKKMIEEQKEKGWEFIFIGANIDAVETASHFGIDSDHAVDYRADSKGTDVVYSAVCDAVSGARFRRKAGSLWKLKITKDYNSRE